MISAGWTLGRHLLGSEGQCLCGGSEGSGSGQCLCGGGGTAKSYFPT